MPITKLGASYMPDYEDPADKLVVHHINSGEAKPYGPGRREAAQIGVPATVAGGVLGGLTRAPRIGAAVGAGTGGALTGLGMYLAGNRKRESRNILDEGDNREKLRTRLSKLRDKGIDTSNPNSLNAYLSRQLKGD